MTPDKLSKEGRFDAFDNKKVMLGKKKNHLPAMGWNSWNAFGSNNTEALSKAMADKFIELGLDKLGYEFIVLDDGCYKPERVDGKLSNEPVKFPNGFRALADYIHGKGLKFGMYNDIGTNLCAGALVGTCGFEEEDAKSYVEWGVDFLKVDNCYYLWDNATFSNPENARYTYAPNIRSIKLGEKVISAVEDGILIGEVASKKDDYVTGIGTFDGTGPAASPIGLRSSELIFRIESDKDEELDLSIEYAAGKHEGVGEWLELFVGSECLYDEFLKETETEETFTWSEPIKVTINKGLNHIRIANHRRQENTLNSYARLLKGLNMASPDHDIIYSACEWGKTQPQNWGYKVCDSWRILNDITFRVGNDGDPGFGSWKDDYTPSVTSQYNKAVIMDEFAGLDRGWNDPDMLMVGMNGFDMTQYRTHMAMWCMMNSPLMLGLDLRRVSKGDELYNIIANKGLIALNQDKLGIQAKRIFSTLSEGKPDKEYIRDINRIDVLAKPLSDNRFALSFINVSEEDKNDKITVSVKNVEKAFAGKYSFASSKYCVKNLWTGEEQENITGVFEISGLKAHDNVTLEIKPL